MNANLYQITVARSAATTISEQLPESVAAAVIELIAGPLTEIPHTVAKPLKGQLEGFWVARRGTFRIIFKIDESRKEIVVVRVAHRRHTYRSIRK